LGEKGLVKVGGQYIDQLIYCDISDYTPPESPPVNPPNQYGEFQGSAANHGHVLQNVIEVLNEEAEIQSPEHEGAQVVDIIERIYKYRSQPNS
jgi:hypothetical protein